MRKWLFYSTVLATFSTRLAVNIGGLTLFFYYFLLLINLTILVLRGEFWLPRKAWWFLTYLTASGALGLAMGSDSTAGFLKSYIGVVICVLYYPGFMRLMRFDAARAFANYARYSYYAALVGFVYLPFQDGGGRLTSVLLEPSIFCLICVPAAYYYADEWQRTGRHRWRCLTLLLALALTSSSVGYIGMMFGVYLFGTRYKWGKLVFPLIVLCAGFAVYTVSDMFRLRLDDSVSAIGTADLTNVNESSLGVALGYFITREAFAEHPLIGGGLGSFVVAHDKFVPRIPALFQLAGNEILDLGRWDASSLLLRVTAELGLLGLTGVGWFLWYYWPHNGTPSQVAIAQAMLCYMMMKFTRAGSYFQTEVFFFLAIYTTNGMLARAERRLRQRAVSALEVRPQHDVTALNLEQGHA